MLTKKESEAQKLARRAKGTASPLVLISHNDRTDFPVGVLMVWGDFILSQYLGTGAASRSAYRRFEKKLKSRKAVTVTSELSEEVSKLNAIATPLEIHSESGKRKAVILPWSIFSLLSRGIQIRSHANLLAEMRRTSSGAVFEETEESKKFEKGLFEKKVK